MRSGISTLIFVLRFRSLSLICACIGAPVIGAAFCISLHAAVQTVADAPTLRVQILNGKTGRPVTNQHLRMFRKDGKAIDGKGETTDGEGYAAIPNVDAAIAEIFIAVDTHLPCSKTGKHDFSLAKVRVSGVVSENVCRPRITMYPQAGTLIFYVRDETFIEKMRR
jgi:hypothetical protein